ncbi:sensor histidine kinase [Alteromonas sp. a30]|uniref:sensor histidine kinase n=1 Tax=Alteromonas sp. a30 TaxID=2730917 RepID=UPI0022819AC3|nr:HAMP domain-containing sensor histidine kinase [Alteromonas sp. a30]MCY7295597.1 HAMP domain-containing histidine kinase [Alteromonas sp. a30]
MAEFKINRLEQLDSDRAEAGLTALNETLDLLGDIEEFIVLSCELESLLSRCKFVYRGDFISLDYDALARQLMTKNMMPEADKSYFFCVQQGRSNRIFLKAERNETGSLFLFILLQKPSGESSKRAYWSLDYLSRIFNALYCQMDNVVQFEEREKIASLINLGRLVPSVTHEINNPLGVGLTSVSHLKTCLLDIGQCFANGELTEENFKEFMEECNEAADLLEYNIDRAVGLVRDFKCNSVNQSADVLTDFNLAKHIRSIINSVSPALKSKQIELHHHVKVDTNLTVNSYPGALFQVLTNLVFNALNHAFEGRTDGRLTLSVVQNDAQVDVVVEDNGVGICDEYLHKIYDPYFTTKKHHGGSGLGLAVVKTLVEDKLKGKIEINSEVDRGTRFHITIPFDD